MAGTDASRGSALFGLAVLAAIGAAFCGLQLAVLTPDHDSAYLLDLAGQILRGGRYFYDFLEINPPLYSLLLLPVYWLRGLTGLALYSCFVIWISLLIVASSVAVWHFVRRLLDEAPVEVLLLGATTEAILFFLPGLDFGQRDHVAIVLILPAFSWMAATRHGEPMTMAGWLVAIAGAVGVLIKPYLVLAVGLAYALRAVEEGTWRVLVEPPVWGAAAIASLYGGLLPLAFPEWFMVVKIGSVAYAGYDAGAWIGKREALSIALIAALAIANELLGRGNDRERRWGRFLAAAALGALGSYVVQHKAIEYQFIPARTLIWLQLGMTALVAARWVATVRGPPPLRRAGALLFRYRALALGIVVMVPLCRIVDGVAVNGRRLDRSMIALAAALRAQDIGPRVAVFGTSVYPAYPLTLYRTSKPAWRFTHPWLVPWIVQQQAAGHGNEPRVLEMEAEQRAMALDDFRRFQPDGILVDESPRKLALPASFDMLAWFRQDPAMAAILDQYQRVGQFDDPNTHRYFFTRLGIYRRRSP